MKELRLDVMQEIHRAAAPLEHLDQRVRLVLVSTELIDQMGGMPATEWSEPVRYRFTEDSHAGFVMLELKAEPS